MAGNRRQRVLEGARVSVGSVVPAAFVLQIGCIRGAVPWCRDLPVHCQVASRRRPMTLKFLGALTLVAMAALELPACPVDAFEAEDGKI